MTAAIVALIAAGYAAVGFVAWTLCRAAARGDEAADRGGHVRIINDTNSTDDTQARRP